MMFLGDTTFYAYRTVGEYTSSAEWSEPLALELGDRVAEHEFAELMEHAVLDYPRPVCITNGALA